MRSPECVAEADVDVQRRRIAGVHGAARRLEERVAHTRGRGSLGAKARVVCQARVYVVRPEVVHRSLGRLRPGIRGAGTDVAEAGELIAVGDSDAGLRGVLTELELRGKLFALPRYRLVRLVVHSERERIADSDQ